MNKENKVKDFGKKHWKLLSLLLSIIVLFIVDCIDFFRINFPTVNFKWFGFLSPAFALLIYIDSMIENNKKWSEERRLSVSPYFIYRIKPNVYGEKLSDSETFDYKFDSNNTTEEVLLPLEVTNVGLGNGIIENIIIKNTESGKEILSFEKNGVKDKEQNNFKMISKPVGDINKHKFFISFPKIVELSNTGKILVEIVYRDSLDNKYYDKLMLSEELYSQYELDKDYGLNSQYNEGWNGKIVPKRIFRSSEQPLPELKKEK